MEINWQDPDSVLKALITLYEMQTEDEKSRETTTNLNGFGFNSVDALILTSFSKQLISRGSISEKQYNVVLDVLPKYTKQLALLKCSQMVASASYGIFAPPQKRDGVLKIQGDKLVFIPEVYPSYQAKELGFVWNADMKGWNAPIRTSLIEGIVRKFPSTLLEESVQEYVEERNKPMDLSSDIHESKLFPYQKKAVEFCLRTKKCLLGMAPGTGKSATAIFAANELNYDRILVVSPLTLTYIWKNQIKQWINEDAVIWHGSVDHWQSYSKWVITNYETVSRNSEAIIAQGFKVIILDESILVKNRHAKRSQAMKIVGKSCDYLWLLSGSPITKFLDDMWMQLNILDPKRFSSYWRFVESYCLIEKNYWGTAVVGNQEDAFDRLKKDISDIYYHVALDDVLDIPDWIFDNIEVPMTTSQYKLYFQMEKEFIADLPDGDQVLSPNVLSQMVRLQQFASNPLLLDGPDDGAKWKALDEILDYEIKPAIIWTQFVRTANYLSSKFSKGYRVETLTGETPVKERDYIVRQFQEGNVDIIVAHPAVGKFGLTLTRARTAIYLERSFNGDDYYQSLYRIRRIGTTLSPHVIHLISSRPDPKDGNTIDHVVDRVLDYRKRSSLEITGNNVQITSGTIRELLGKKGGS